MQYRRPRRRIRGGRRQLRLQPLIQQGIQRLCRLPDLDGCGGFAAAAESVATPGRVQYRMDFQQRIEVTAGWTTTGRLKPNVEPP